MRIEKEDTQYIKYAKRIQEMCKRSGIPLYSSKYSNNLYTNHQFIVLDCFKQYERKGYERFIDDLPDKPHLIEFLKLRDIPHFTAMHKFVKRTKQTVLDLILAMALARLGIQKVVGGVDGTGNKPHRASTYYVKRLAYFLRKKKKRKRGRPKKNRKVRRIIKTFPFVELRLQMPIAVGFSRRSGNESPYFKPVAKRALQCGKPFSYVSLDKGFDAEYVHEFINEDMDSRAIIPARNEDVPIHRTSGWYRKKMKRGYSKKEYHQRSKSETVNFVMDALMGEEVYANDWRMQNKELLFKYIMYAAYRFDKIKRRIYALLNSLLENLKKAFSEVNPIY